MHVVPTQLFIVVSQQPPPQATLEPEQVRQSVPVLLHPFAQETVDWAGQAPALQVDWRYLIPLLQDWAGPQETAPLFELNTHCFVPVEQE